MNPPGPFTTAELIPSQVHAEVTAYAVNNDKMHARALRGANGWQPWQAAKRFREEPGLIPLVYSEQQALNQCGWGHVWRRRENEDLWDAVQPSSWPEDPPDTSLKIQRCIDDAAASKYPDAQQTSWTANGYPGAREMPKKAVVSYSHVGAIRETALFVECAKKDISKGFVTAGHDFPDVWPCVIDPMNVVIQRGKPRLCIDKSLSLGWEESRDADDAAEPDPPAVAQAQHRKRTRASEDTGETAPAKVRRVPPEQHRKRMRASGDPEDAAPKKLQRVRAYNSYIDLAKDKADGVRVTLPRTWEGARATAILKSSGYVVLVGKFDLSSFFRMHGKQREFLWQSGRLIPQLGYGTDLRENFGGSDTPDHDCRESNFLAWQTRRELIRLDREYPPHHSESALVEWLAERAGIVQHDGESYEEYRVAVMFYVMYFVDDCFLAVISTMLYLRGEGEPIMIQEVNNDGSTQLVPRQRGSMYFEAALGVAQYYGHKTPVDKMSRMDLWVVYLGTLMDMTVELRLLDIEKRARYLEDLRGVRAGVFLLKDGSAVSDKDTTNSLQCKLTHCLEVIPAGRLRLFYLRRDISAENRLDTPGSWTIISKDAARELDWWEAQLERSSRHGIPLATRFSFPGESSPSHLIEYHDASRDRSHATPSGWGAWGIIEGPEGRVFVYIFGEWTWQEVEHFSINVLESKTRDMATFTFIAYARSIGCTITHTTGFNDNTCAQFNAEFGRPGTELLRDMLQERYDRLHELGVFAANERCASIDNTLADDLSRGEIKSALAVPQHHGMQVVRLHVPAELRRFPERRQ